MKRRFIALAAVAAMIFTSAAPAPAQSAFDLALSHAWSATVVDFDGDGDEDVLLIRHQPTRRDLLMRNNGGRFVVWMELPGKDRHDCTAIDANVDGRLDFYCSSGADNGWGKGLNELWLNTSGGWVESAAKWGAQDPYGRGRHVATVDWNRDGLPDLFVGAEARPDGRHAPGRLWINEGGRFKAKKEWREWGNKCAHTYLGGLLLCDIVPEQRAVWRGPGMAQTISFGETVSADSGGDVLATLTRTHLLVNGKKITTPRRGFDIAVGDFNGDGRHDVYVLAGDCRGAGKNPKDMVYLWSATGWKLAREPKAPGGCGGVVERIDHDNDGVDSVVVMEGGTIQKPGPIHLWHL